MFTGFNGIHVLPLETFRFEDKNDYEYKISFKVFSRHQKIDTQEFFIVLFSTR